MRKAIIATLIILVLTLTACSNNSNTIKTEITTDNKESTENVVKDIPLDLIGNWVHEGKEFDETYQAGYIAGDRIEIYWIFNGGETSSLYWSGTYEAPQEAVDKYSWESKNDKTRTGMAILASGSDLKLFTYENGKITYEVSYQGETATVPLIATETDYTSLGTVTESADTTNLQEVELIDSGYGITHNDGRTNIVYAVTISNPNSEYAIRFPVITITARDSDGKILKVEEMILHGIAAGDEYTYGNDISYEGEIPSDVEITIRNREDNFLAQSSSGIIKSDKFLISNISEIKGSYKKTYTGEVTNNSTEDLKSVLITVVYKSGDRIVGGETSYVHDVNSGDTRPFEISIYSHFEDYDSFEIYALQWF